MANEKRGRPSNNINEQAEAIRRRVVRSHRSLVYDGGTIRITFDPSPQHAGLYRLEFEPRSRKPVSIDIEASQVGLFMFDLRMGVRRLKEHHSTIMQSG